MGYTIYVDASIRDHATSFGGAMSHEMPKSLCAKPMP